MINIKRIISITEARRRIFDIAEEVQTPKKTYMLTAGGKPKAVIMSAKEYQSLVETIEVEKIFPDLNQDIVETKAALKSGEYKKWPTLNNLKRDWGMAVKFAETPNKKYGVYSSHKAKGKKKSR
ncbi:MAG: type II toxin-antitoxin system Phd/YefM family antitoxin [bacterium]|nr:type II toxin-antitoxin system Phd/YefM family antitoxin [bacterium]